jgi:hypothetical protein
MCEMNERNIGSSFDSWLREEGIYESTTFNAIKRVLARQVAEAIKERNLYAHKPGRTGPFARSRE